MYRPINVLPDADMVKLISLLFRCGFLSQVYTHVSTMKMHLIQQTLRLYSCNIYTVHNMYTACCRSCHECTQYNILYRHVHVSSLKVSCINNIHKDIIITEELKMMRIHYIHTIAIMILTTTCSLSSKLQTH